MIHERPRPEGDVTRLESKHTKSIFYFQRDFPLKPGSMFCFVLDSPSSGRKGKQVFFSPLPGNFPLGAAVFLPSSDTNRESELDPRIALL